MGWRAPFPNARATWVKSIAFGVLSAAAATALRWSTTSVLGFGLPFISYFPFLLAASIWGGARGGAIALVLSAAASGWLFFAPGDPARAWATGSFVISGGLVVVAGALLAEAVRVSRDRERRLEMTEAQLRTVASELAHRGRNAITVLMSIVSQSIRRAGSLEEAEQVINSRLEALARAQDEIFRAEGKSAPVSALLARNLEPFDLSHFAIRCDPAPAVGLDAAGAVSLILHELATNAVKYGALSGGGRVEIDCQQAGPVTRIVWREVGGPRVESPTAYGFGQRLLTMALAPLGGRASRRFEPAGVVCEIEIPAAPD